MIPLNPPFEGGFAQLVFSWAERAGLMNIYLLSTGAVRRKFSKST